MPTVSGGGKPTRYAAERVEDGGSSKWAKATLAPAASGASVIGRWAVTARSAVPQ